MHTFTKWFDAEIHVPALEGWYDCKECDVRHYFKDGLWYRDKESLRVGPMTIRKMHWRGLAKPSRKSLVTQSLRDITESKEDQEWLNMAPVGREFGSPNYERLMEKDSNKILANVRYLIGKSSEQCYEQNDLLKDKKIRLDATNVQAALKELGFVVTVQDAAAVWVRYSRSLSAGWIAGAETVKNAKKTLISYCSLGTEHFMRGV